MPEPESPNGWTLDTLATHLTSKIEALDRFCVTNFAQGKERVDMALAASDKAIGKAELATEKRFEGVNEFRQTLADQASHLMPRAEYKIQNKAMDERVSTLAADVIAIKSGAAGSATARTERRLDTGLVVVICTGFISAAGIVVAILGLGLHH